MLELNGKKMCSRCFSKYKDGIECACGDEKNSKNALQVGAILSGRYVVGKEIGVTDTTIEYLSYDSVDDKVVIIKEFVPKLGLAGRSSDAKMNVDSRDLNAYNTGMQKFIAQMKVPREKLEAECFIKITNSFYENNTAYFVVDFYEHISLKEYLKTNGPMSEKKAVRCWYQMLEGIVELNEKRYIHSNLSDETVYITHNGICVDGFEPYMEDFAKEYVDSFVFKRNACYLPTSALRKSSRNIMADEFSVGAVMYTMVTGKTPEEAFKTNKRFDIELLRKKVKDGRIADIIEKLCVDTVNGYKNIDELVTDANKVFESNGLKKLPVKKAVGKTVEIAESKQTKTKIVIAFIATVVVAVCTVVVVKNLSETDKDDSFATETETATEMITEAEEAQELQIDNGEVYIV